MNPLIHLQKQTKTFWWDLYHISASQESCPCKCKIDTETYTSNIDSELANKLGLVPQSIKRVYNYLGDSNLGVAPVDIIFSTGESKGTRISTYVTIADRSKLNHPIAIGRKDVGNLNLLIDVNKSL